MYVSIRYQYNASGMCENPGSVLKQHHIQRITVNLKLTFYRKSYMKVFATTDVALRNKDSDWRIYIDPPIYQMHVENMMLTRGKICRRKKTSHEVVLAC